MNELKPGDVLKCITDRCHFGGREWSGDDTIFVTKIKKFYEYPDTPGRGKDWDFITGLFKTETVCFHRVDLYEKFIIV